MPVEQKNGMNGESTFLLNARGAEKKDGKGIEQAFRCPRSRKKGWKGNRTGFSMPAKPKKRMERELSRLLDARGAEKKDGKGIEQASRCPWSRKKG